ncbi:hypothetical protein [Brucella anthropi]|uniref:hypothetical protein n=1 Tax=Brucella anthropi TaxID=529 RepID=UPI000F688398|nr:hypothetical protein [Brucella anthropi]RRY08852.1 hypothetical protein EGJ58_13215 [Brucella anthropi]
MHPKERIFPPISIQAEGGRRRVHRIQCSQCPAYSDVSANTISGTRNIDDLLKGWKRAGWLVGSRRNRDLCPTCYSAKRRRGSGGFTAEAVETIPSNSPDTEAMPVVEPTVSVNGAEPPSQPTFEEKRIIFAKLEEVYLDHRTGYSSDWSDQRVADDLGVPRKWVEVMRDANFGPERSDEAIKTALAEAIKLRDEIAELLKSSREEAALMRARADLLEKKTKPLVACHGDIVRQIEALESAVSK